MLLHLEDRERTRPRGSRALAGAMFEIGVPDLHGRARYRRRRARRWRCAIGTALFRQLGTLRPDEARRRAKRPGSCRVSRRRDEFLAVLAHELRNPLAPIRNWATALREQPADAARHQQAWEVIDRQLSRLTRLVDDLFDASRISEGKLRIRKEILDVRAVVDAALEAVEHEIESRGHRLDLDLPRVVRDRGDPSGSIRSS
jgi:signal transduction histidine kinase